LPSTGGGGSTNTGGTATVSAGATTQTASLSQITSGLSGSVTIPPTTSGSGTATISLSATAPSGVPVVSSVARLPASISGNGVTLTPLAYVTVSSSATLNFPTYPSFTFIFPTSMTFPSGTSVYLALFSASTGWSTLAGPATISGSTVTFTTTPGPDVLTAGATQTFALLSTAQTLNPTAAFTCPTNDQTQSVARSNPLAGSDAVHRATGLRANRKSANSATGLLAVTYSSGAVSGSRATAAASSEQSAGASMVHQLAFARTGKVIHVVSVPAAQMSTAAATLRSQAGVESVATTGLRRYSTAITTPFFPNDPYFNGFTASQNTNAGNPAPITRHVTPYSESSIVPGQWDMHAIGLESAMAYSQAGNGSTVAVNPGALGSSSVKIAIIDTGEDPNHPELASKIAYQKCFITNAAGTAQSTSNFETDPLGHGTDVAGIAAAATNNNLGFAAAGGDAEIYAYRVFPTPDDNCANESTNDVQCSSSTADIADAINDAVAQHVNVISMSLGGEDCSSPGVDSDPVEGAAVANAIAAGIIVVAASGNSGGAGVGTPACDSGVIAVGATSLADGTPNGSGNSLGTATTPVEYVATYSQFGSVNAIRSSTSWGIVAPGGDPSGAASDNDDLHWIENIWTTTPYQLTTSDNNFTGECAPDYASTSQNDCRTLIAGTSMATPHVAGAAALILSATGGSSSQYQSSSAMMTLLCSTADNINSSIQGCGRLNVYNAMAKALMDPNPPTPIQ
jgi:subtilisin family serine protease